MSQARKDLLTRLSRLAIAASKDEINSKPAHEEEWNERARLLKIGIALSVFTSLEDFVKRRVVEVLLKLNTISPKSKALPSGLVNALTIEAIKTAAGRINHADRFKISDIRAFAIEQAKKIASLADNLIIPSDMALADNNSNISWALIDDALLSFGVVNPASVMSGIAQRIAGGVFASKDHFEKATQLRHQVAHEPWFDMPAGDMAMHLRTGAMLCCSFDLALSTAAARIVHGTLLTQPAATANKDVALIYVEKSGGKWRHKKEGAKKGKVAADEDLAFEAARNAGGVTRSCVVIAPVDAKSPCTRWDTPFL